MVERGLQHSSYSTALTAMKRIGYYRFSAYTYPFREPGDDRRGDQFVSGSTFEHALHLYSFDEKLRVTLLEALNVIEVGLGVKVAYALGKRDPLGHLTLECLDAGTCNEYLHSSGMLAHEAWLERYEKLKRDARDEEYVKHHIREYDGKVPIWVATEFLDFGALVRLYSFLLPSDRKKISEELGLANDAAGVLYRWLKALNILRNHCAHNNRVWNRSTVEVPPKFATAMVGDEIHHLNALDNEKRQKLYHLATLAAYLTIRVNPMTNWPRAFKTQARKLADVMGMTVENSMGFPDGWDELEVWNYEPRAES